MKYYPSDETGRLNLADELDRLGFRPTQHQSRFKRVKIEKMARAMVNGRFDWLLASLQPIVLGPKREVLGGHHRIIAAYLTGTDVNAITGPRPQIQKEKVCLRPVYNWRDVLPITS